MSKLRWSDALQRKTRQDNLPELGVSTWTSVRKAIKEGKTGEALELIDYELGLVFGLIDSLTMFRNMSLARLAEFDEDAVGKIERERYTPWVKIWLSTTPGVEESLRRSIEQFRVHSQIEIIEEPDRYVMKLDPCGTGGRLRRSGKEVSGTKKAQPWSWGKSGVCYYCTHCCLMQEVLSIEMRGYPICVTQYPDNPAAPCVHLYYKKPELIPDEFFIRLGKTPWRLRSGSQLK